MRRVLVTGASGHIGSEVVSQLRGTGCVIRTMSRAARMPNVRADVEFVRGDLTAANTLDACVDGIDSVFLVWTAPLAAAAPAIERIAAHARHVVRWFFADAATAPVHERDIAAVAVRALCDERHESREYVLTGPASLTQREQVQIIGDTVMEVTGQPARAFRDWALDHAGDFAHAP